MRIGLLASGQLGQNVVKYFLAKSGLTFVMTDRKSTDIIQLAKEKKVPYFIGNPRDGRSQDFIKDKQIDVLISVNYLFIIEKDLIRLPSKIAFNIHGSLLPKYRGRTPHVWAIINNEVETGITAHLIDNGCDTGDIIEQIKIPIGYYETGAEILRKYSENYIPLIERVISKIESSKLILLPQDNLKATYFGKRTPEDGRIDWNWQKERIRNWVRAQAYPYPGAFSSLGSKKIVIDEVVFDERGYEDDIPNGLILSTEPFLVKSPNGVIKIKRYRDIDFQIQSGKILE
ncbi:methionyl-tRNA formyltransferase [Fontibacter flavus]|uniref:Methionyl-tRNA formyltransferase n=1 Tax=Fontibacter flavus TaxID=654838 RepID=A0ABV6FW36_9BACT